MRVVYVGLATIPLHIQVISTFISKTITVYFNILLVYVPWFGPRWSAPTGVVFGTSRRNVPREKLLHPIVTSAGKYRLFLYDSIAFLQHRLPAHGPSRHTVGWNEFGGKIVRWRCTFAALTSAHRFIATSCHRRRCNTRAGYKPRGLIGREEQRWDRIITATESTAMSVSWSYFVYVLFAFNLSDW